MTPVFRIFALAILALGLAASLPAKPAPLVPLQLKLRLLR